MTTKKTETRGGYRPGAGRKAIFDLGQNKRTQIIKEIDAEAKANKTSFGCELGRLIFNPSGDKRLKLAAMQLYVRDVLPKVSERDVTETKITGPAVYLPEQHPRLKAVEGGKK